MTISAPDIYLGLKHWEKRVFPEKQRFLVHNRLHSIILFELRY